MARSYAKPGRRAEARRLYREALEIWQRTLQAGVPEIAVTLNNLGALCHVLNNLAEMYRGEGRYTEAEKLYRRLIETLPHDDLTRGAALNNLGELCRQKYRFAAESYYLQALEVWQGALGPDHPNKAATEKNLALLRQGLLAANR